MQIAAHLGSSSSTAINKVPLHDFDHMVTSGAAPCATAGYGVPLRGSPTGPAPTAAPPAAATAQYGAEGGR